MSNNNNGSRRRIRREPEQGALVLAAIAGIDAIIDEAFEGLRESWCQPLAAGIGKDTARFFARSMARSEPTSRNR